MQEEIHTHTVAGCCCCKVSPFEKKKKKKVEQKIITITTFLFFSPHSVVPVVLVREKRGTLVHLLCGLYAVDRDWPIIGTAKISKRRKYYIFSPGKHFFDRLKKFPISNWIRRLKISKRPRGI